MTAAYPAEYLLVLGRPTLDKLRSCYNRCIKYQHVTLFLVPFFLI